MIGILSLIILAALPLPLSFGADLGISHGSKNELILTSSNCKTLIEQREALCLWKQSIEPSFEIPTLPVQECHSNPNGSFTISVADCLPELALKQAGKKLYHQGPNCWGTAMSFHGLSIKPRFLWPEEIHYWMDSPVCRKLEVGEPMLPGDVINVYYPENIWGVEMLKKTAGTNFWEALYPNRYTPLPLSALHGYSGYDGLLHSVTYLSPELAFGKDGPSESDRFYFHRLAEVYGRPRDSSVPNASNLEGKICQENPELIPYLRENQQAPKTNRHPGCPYFSVAFRCGNILEYFKQQGLTDENKDRLASIQSLQKIQTRLYDLVVRPNTALTSIEIKTFLQQSDSIAARALKLLREKSRDKSSEMLLTMEYFTAVGIRKSLDQAGYLK